MTRADRLASGTLTDADRRILSMRGYRVWEYLADHPIAFYGDEGQHTGGIERVPCWIVEDMLGQRVIRADALAALVDRLEGQG